MSILMESEIMSDGASQLLWWRRPGAPSVRTAFSVKKKKNYRAFKWNMAKIFHITWINSAVLLLISVDTALEPRLYHESLPIYLTLLPITFLQSALTCGGPNIFQTSHLNIFLNFTKLAMCQEWKHLDHFYFSERKFIPLSVQNSQHISSFTFLYYV